MLVAASALSPVTAQRISYVRAIKPKNETIAAYLKTTLDLAESSLDISDLVTALHRLQKLEIAAKLNILDHPEIISAFNDTRFPEWRDYATLPVAKSRQQHMGDVLFDVGTIHDKPHLLLAYDYTKDISEQIVLRAINAGEEIDVFIDDKHFNRRLLNILDKEGAEKYAAYRAERYNGFGRRMPIISNYSSTPYFDKEPPANIRNIESTTFLKERIKPGCDWSDQEMNLTMLPTPDDARLDGIPYDEYLDLFIKMWEVDVEKINACHKLLIAKLNKASLLHITNDDGTDVTFDITDMTFSNSLADHNIPGTEIFSAPRVNGTNGRIVAKGKFAPYTDERIVEDIELEFTDGVITNYNAKIGFEYLKNMIETDEGSNRLGEVALGTNPALQKHVCNTLLVEKICRSFHVAIGDTLHAHDANTTNGNRSGVHWDITTMLVGKNGRIEVDGEAIMEKGVYTMRGLEYLNGAA